ncbi:hypothetical protein IBX73_08905 [candidate division WOR-3 bacterium]|nr:hypothetical protein [candidate division WOR-3 bacterium]
MKRIFSLLSIALPMVLLAQTWEHMYEADSLPETYGWWKNMKSGFTENLLAD